MGHRLVVASLAVFAIASYGHRAMGQSTAYPDQKVSATVGPNNAAELDPCCYEDARPVNCNSCGLCAMRAQSPCTPCCYDDPPCGQTCGGCCPHQLTEHPDWVQPAEGAVCCDDDPKHQQEPSIAAPWWDPDVALAVFMDGSLVNPGGLPEGMASDAFAVSTNGGVEWNRLDRDIEFAPDPCEASLSFVPGFARTEQDICTQGSRWEGSGDPGTATGFDDTIGAETGYLYFTANLYFARLKIDPDTGAPLGQWEAVNVPRGDLVAGTDKPYVSANPEGKEVYVHWITTGDDIQEYLTFSCDYGNEFFAEEPGGCTEFGSFSEALQISFLESVSEDQPDSKWGNASAVGPDGEVHFIWPLRDDDGFDQIYLRTLWWDDQTGDPYFVPELPSGAECTPGVSCELAIIHDQPGITGDGYDETHRGRVRDSLNIQTITHPSIAVDRNDPDEPCGFGGYVYVAYAAEEPNKEYTGEFEDYVFVDSNIYVVRSRDRGLTWSEPLRIDTHGASEEGKETECPSQLSPCPGGVSSFRRPIQFYPWIAVDRQGRVGLMWHDTHPDFEGGHADADPCDGDVIYNIHFAWSLDGGVSWLYGWEINDAVSETGVGTSEDWDECGFGITLGEYSGLTATSTDGTAEGDGIFHAIWTDFREYTSGWREDDHFAFTPTWPTALGDIYTTKVVLEDALYGMGDFDRDYDADMDDFANFTTCGVQPLPPECEILDLNRSNEIDNLDPYLFMQNCFTGPGGGESAGGGTSEVGEEEVTDPLDAMVQWCLAVMSAGERAELADLIRDAADGVEAGEAARMNSFADAIDPAE